MNADFAQLNNARTRRKSLSIDLDVAFADIYKKARKDASSQVNDSIKEMHEKTISTKPIDTVLFWLRFSPIKMMLLAFVFSAGALLGCVVLIRLAGQDQLPIPNLLFEILISLLAVLFIITHPVALVFIV